MQIKIQLSKLNLNRPLTEMIANQQQTNNIQVPPVTLTHVLALESLPAHHKDPFDRLLIARANAEDAIIISRDTIIAKYPVQLVW